MTTIAAAAGWKMNKISTFICGVVFLLIIPSSCRQKNREYVEIKEGDTYVLNDGIEMKTDDPDFIITRMINMHDSTLYAMSRMNDTLVNIYRIQNDSLIPSGKFLNKGNGPYEMNVYICIYQNETLSFFENQGKLTKGYAVHVKSDEAIHNTQLWKTYDFSKISDYRIGTGYVYVSDSLLLVTGGKPNSRELLSIINLNNPETVYPLDFWPDDGFENNNFVKQAIYMSNAKLFRNERLDKYLYVSGEAGKYMEIFSIKDFQLTDRLPVCQVYPKYKVTDDGYFSAANSGMNRGFYVYATDHYIYAKPEEFTLEMLRSGQTHNGYDLNFNRIIDVFDWEGNFVRRYEADTPFYSFIVDETNGILYTQTTDPETGDSLVKKYSLDLTAADRR
jgi:hypothetical protein